MTEQKENVYVRMDLAATKAGLPQPTLEIEVWLDQLAELLRQVDEAEKFYGHDGAMPELPEPQDAYDWLALVGKLGRVRPEMIEQCNGTADLERARAILLARRGTEIARRAMTILNPEAWVQEVATFDSWLEDLPLPSAEVERAVSLFEDLDDAELVVAMARRFGVTDADLEAGVEKCVDWLCQHTDLFMAGSLWVQAVGAGMRPELEDEDYDLAVTALKFCNFLDVAVDAEAELTLENVKPLPAEVVTRLFEAYEESKKT